MKLQFTVSPDFAPESLAAWHIFNTYLQRQTGLGSHFETYESYQDLHAAIDNGEVDLIFANAYDSASLVRDKGYAPLASPEGQADEVVIAVAEGSPVLGVEELAPGITIASTADPDVQTIGMIMLEPANLDKSNTRINVRGSYPLVAKSLMRNEAAAGFFLAEAYERFSEVIKQQLRPLVRSYIQVINHCFLLSPNAIAHKDQLLDLLAAMHTQANGERVLQDLGYKAWHIPPQEEVEFTLDLMSTLVEE
ncbi:MAG: phosphate/phosphite/phosphonate ABC transporter substrate-binding protein [Cellvibrionaceae bacterium]|nr:phosphate/phosphite/phosphonate ABC transporter substrate-binding protein [Cellvibrionaceae bacterium]